MTLLKDETSYKIVPFRPYPIVAIKRRVKKLLWRLVQENKITGPTYCHLKCGDKDITLKFYEQPKIHKYDIPLRFIVFIFWFIDL